MVVQIFYNLTDTFFVGRLNDPFQMAAVSVSFPIFMITMAVSGIFGFGASSFISRLLGQKNYLMAKKASSTAFYSCLFISVLVTILGTIFMSSILKLIGITTETAQHAFNYLSIILYGNIIIMTNFCLAQLIRSEGAAKTAMLGMFIGTGINIILDPIFILWLGFGVKEAAVATVIGEAGGLLYYLNFYTQKRSLISINWKYFSFQKEIFLEIFSVGIPASINNIMIGFAQTLSNSVAASYNDMLVAAYGINHRIFSMAIMILIGLSQSTQPLIGYNYGARNIKRFNEIFRTASVMATGVSIFFCIFFYFFAEGMMQIFINNPQVITYGKQIMRAIIISLPFAGILFLIRVSFQALGKGKPALILALSRQGLFYAPALFLLNHFFGFSGFIFAQPFANILACALAVILYYHIKIQIDNEHLEVADKLTKPMLEEDFMHL